MVNNNKTLKKIFTDTLKSPNGKWSRKSLTLFVSFLMCIVLAIHIVLAPFFGILINDYTLKVFDGFMFLVVGLTVGTIADKFSPNSNKKEEQEV